MESKILLGTACVPSTNYLALKTRKMNVFPSRRKDFVLLRRTEISRLDSAPEIPTDRRIRRVHLFGAVAEPEKSETECEIQDDCRNAKTTLQPRQLVSYITQRG